MRASAAVERAGVPSVSLVCDGFIRQGAAIASGLGIDALPIARIPGHVDSQSASELERNIVEHTLGEVVTHLTQPVANSRDSAPTDVDGVLVEGSFEAVNEYFLAHDWSDGLPIVPPTRERVDAFLAQTEDSADRVIGTLAPSGCEATVLWPTVVPSTCRFSLRSWKCSQTRITALSTVVTRQAETHWSF